MKKNHIQKQLIIACLASLFLFFLASKLFEWDEMYKAFGFFNRSDYIGIFLVGVLWEPLGLLLSPIGMAISRRFEREADAYAAREKNTALQLLSALKKMAKKNLSNLRPHPFFALLNYAHPPLLQRVEFLESTSVVKT